MQSSSYSATNSDVSVLRDWRTLAYSSALSFMLAAASAASSVRADCPDFGIAGAAYPVSIGNAVSGPCTMPDGRAGHHACDPDPRQKNIICVPTEPAHESGSAYPKYLIMTVVYAPPGSQDCAHNSMVSYGNGNSVGTKVSSSSSFKAGTNVQVKAKGGALGSGAEVGVSFGVSGTDSDSQEMSITKSTSSTLTASGACHDGIDHDQDQVWLLLGPEVQIETSEAAGCKNCEEGLSWDLGESGEIVWVRVGELKGTLEMRSGIADAFQRYGITSDDTWQMLMADPLADQPGDSSAEPDSSRFVRVPMSFPYEPAAGGSSGNRSYEMRTEVSNTNASASSVDYSVGVSVSGSLSFISFVSASLSAESSWTWSSSNSSSDTDSSSTAASVSVGSPSDGYTGPTSIAVFYDTVFKSYAFIPVGG
jgi:hypothetical protein